MSHALGNIYLTNLGFTTFHDKLKSAVERLQDQKILSALIFPVMLLFGIHLKEVSIQLGY